MSDDGGLAAGTAVRRRRRRRPRWPGIATALVVLLVCGGAAEPAPGPGETPVPATVDPAQGPAAVVAASLPVWNLAGGASTIATHAVDLAAASPNLYEVAPDGTIVVRAQPAGVLAPVHLELLRSRGIALVPTISNTRDGSWDPPLIQAVLHDPELLSAHVRAIVELVGAQDLAGVDIDYEELDPADREVFSAFITRLADALHAEGRLLTVDLFAKDSDAGYDDRNLAQDYAAIGAAADQVRLMAYDWHWETSGPGPIAPVDWVDRVLDYAVREIPAHKIVLGVPTYGYGWGPQGAELVSWLQVYDLARTSGEPVRWDSGAQSPWLRYVDDEGVERTVWFENAYSVGAKLAVAQAHGIGGVYLWLVGDEDDALWSMVSAYRSGTDMREVGVG